MDVHVAASGRPLAELGERLVLERLHVLPHEVRELLIAEGREEAPEELRIERVRHPRGTLAEGEDEEGGQVGGEEEDAGVEPEDGKSAPAAAESLDGNHARGQL